MSINLFHVYSVYMKLFCLLYINTCIIVAVFTLLENTLTDHKSCHVHMSFCVVLLHTLYSVSIDYLAIQNVPKQM